MSDEIKDFVEECLDPDQSQRKYVTQLMDHDFIMRHRGNNLQKIVQSEMHMQEDGQEIINCYKLQIANVINEIIHRHMTHNTQKFKAILAIDDDFQKTFQHEDYAAMQNYSHQREGGGEGETASQRNKKKMKTHKPKIAYRIVYELVKQHMDSFETERIFSQFPAQQDQLVSFTSI